MVTIPASITNRSRRERKMTDKQMISTLKSLTFGTVVGSKGVEALDMAIKAAENIGHLTDRPCSVCEFNKDNGCCKWSCVFER